MKTAIIYTIIGLLAINSLMAQVKIGDNPQNLDPASLLELESTTRALVITRVTDAQMSTINPLRGAIVYNTDQGCLHYYDGMAWINICEALDDSFTTSTEDGTIVITQDGDNYDISVGLIDGTNIRNFTIGALDIQGGAIDSQHYANNSINPEEHFNILDNNTRQIIIWNGTDWVYTLESDLQISEHQDLADVVANDSSAGNSLITDLLDPSGAQDAATKNYVDTEIINNAADGSETAINAGTDINITGNGTTTTPYVINSTFSEAQDLEDVISINPSAGGNAITNLLNPTDPQDAATKNYVDSEITNNAADGTETEITGAGINVVTGDGSSGNPYEITATEAQDLEDVISINPSAGGNAITNLLNPTDPQDAATKNYVDSEITNNAADGTETEITGAGINVVTGDGSSGNPYEITATEAQDLEDVISINPSAGGNAITNLLNPTDPQDAATKNYVDSEITNNAADGTETEITGAGINVVTGDGSSGNPYEITATEAQDLEDVISINPSAGGNAITNLLNPTDPQDAATKNYVDSEITNNAADGTETEITGAGINVVTGDGSSGNPYEITATEAQDLEDVISINPSAGGNAITNLLNPTDPQDAATKNYVDSEITNNAADGTETEITGAGINVVTGDGSSGNPYEITATEAQDLEDVISINPSAGGNAITNLLNPTDPQDAATKNYVDSEITNNAADGTETEITGAGINVVTGDGSSGNPYEITATEAQDLEDVISINPSAGGNAITNLLNPTDPQDAATKAYVDALVKPILTTGSDIILDSSHYTIVLGGDHAITLPAANTLEGRVYIIKNNTVFNPSISTFVDNSGTNISVIPSGVIHIQSDGTNWQQIY